MVTDGIELSDEQQAVYQRLETTPDCYFITGKAGTGKSVLLRYFVEHTHKKVAVVAPTGIAAVNVGGQTIHSFFGMDTSVQDVRINEAVYGGMNDEHRRIFSSLDTLIIDEISMVRVDTMDMIDHKLRVARQSGRPFGGCQIIVFGDLYQLPPVVKEENVNKFLTRRYGTIYFYGASACTGSQFHFVELVKVFRQSDPAFIDMLNHIRTGNPQWAEVQTLNARNRRPPKKGEIITLTSRNDAAQKINDRKLDELSSEAHQYYGEVEGIFGEEEMPTALVLTLKKGAQVMMLRNDVQKRWFNGSLARIAELSDDLIKIEIDGHIFPIDKEVWVKYAYEYNPEELTITRQPVGSFRQYPLRLAYAITIHKSQGQTFDSVIIDYSEGAAFAPGQTYVALSRCRSFDSLYLTSALSLEDVRVNQEIVDYTNRGLAQEKGLRAMIGKDMQVLQGQRFSDSAAALPKQIRSKIQPTIKQLMDNPDLPGLHVEKIGDDGLFSARVDDTYRIIFAILDSGKILSLLFVGPHEEAYQFANRYKVEVNPSTGGLQQVEKAPRRISTEEGSGKRLSRLAALEDIQLVSMGIPEEYWQQLREKVFTVGQLTGFRSLIPQEAYDTLEFILEGTPVDEAIEIWESITSSVTPVAVEERKPIFADFSPEELVSVGIPTDNVDKVRRIKTDKELEIIAATLPVLAQQSLYALKAGETIEDVRKTTFAAAKQNREGDLSAAVRSPITLAEFAPIDSEEALRAILEFPSEKWRVFLHPTQSEIIRQDYNGPARIVGGAGTGKTVVIVHRAKRLASECAAGERVLVTTFGNTLKHDIDERIEDICSEAELEHIEVVTVDKLTMDLAKQFFGRKITYAYSRMGVKLVDVWRQAMTDVGMPNAFDTDFCMDEWRDVIQVQNITTLDGYLSAQRSGRGKQLDRSRRERFWRISERYKALCDQKRVFDAEWVQNLLVEKIRNDASVQYQAVIVDECQDLRAPALRMLRALAGAQRKNDMYLSGDSRQRIYGGRASLSQCGIQINNRSRVLKLNYRTTDEIYSFAMQLQRDYQYDDLDGKSMSKDKSTCIFHGPAPFIRHYDNPEEEAQEMIRDIRALIATPVLPSDICVMARSIALLRDIRDRLERNGLRVLTVDNEHPDDKSIPGVRIMTMHRGKGMEFSYVYLPCLRDDVIPSRRDIEKAEDEEMLNEIMLSEANLLSVAITRAKHQVWLSYSGRPSSLITRYIS